VIVKIIIYFIEVITHVIWLQYTEARLNEGLGHQIHQNRTEFQNLMDEKGTKPPPANVCVAAVVVEDFIT